MKRLINLNRRLLMTQALSKRTSGPHSVVAATDACCGINSQDYTGCFASFWARVDGFNDADLLSELRPGGRLVRTWTVRGTMHIFPSEEYHVYVIGSRGKYHNLALYENAAKQRGLPPSEKRIELFYEPFLMQIRGRSATSNEVKQFMSERLHRFGLKSSRTGLGWTGQTVQDPLWIGLSEMSYMGLIVNAGRKGSQSLWMRADDWIPDKRKALDPDECVIELVRKYVDKYGPASRSDILYWSGLRTDEVDSALKTLQKELTQMNIEGSRELYFSLGPDTNHIDEPPKAIVLPSYDSLLMGYKDKSRLMSSNYVKKVFGPLGVIRPTILVDGFVVAVWRRKRDRKTISVDVDGLRRLETPERRAIEEKFVEYGRYMDAQVSLRWL